MITPKNYLIGHREYTEEELEIFTKEKLETLLTDRKQDKTLFDKETKKHVQELIVQKRIQEHISIFLKGYAHVRANEFFTAGTTLTPSASLVPGSCPICKYACGLLGKVIQF